MTDSDYIVPPPFSIEVADSPTGVTLLVVAGEVDVATSGRFRQYVDQAAQSGVRALIADLSDVTFIDSTMLRELLRARDELAGAGGRFVIVGAGASVLRLLDLTGTTSLFSLVQTRDEALDGGT